MLDSIHKLTCYIPLLNAVNGDAVTDTLFVGYSVDILLVK